MVKVVKGKCPDPCSAATLGALEDEARKRAKADSDRHCKSKVESGECACEGKYQTLVRNCETQTLEDCGDVCLYYVTVAYVGECKKQ